jgi:hypothetical protein
LLQHDEDAIRFVLCQFQGVVSDKVCNYCLKEGRKCVKIEDKPDESCAECLYSKLTCTPEVIDLTFDDGVEIKEEVISEPVRIESGTTDRQESKGTEQRAATKRTRTDEDEQNRFSKKQDESIDGTGQIVKRSCVSLHKL